MNEIMNFVKGKVSLIIPVLTAKFPPQLRHFRLQRKSFCLETSFYFHHGLITAENMSSLETSCLCACGHLLVKHLCLW